MYGTNVVAQKLETVPSVDLNKYAGKWYEIASFPQRFQKGCNCTTAEYTATNKGYVIVENRCNKGSVNGKQSYIKGKAFYREKFRQREVESAVLLAFYRQVLDHRFSGRL